MMPEDSPQPLKTDEAVFIGWQKTVKGDFVPLYNVVLEGHPSHGSTLSEHGLRKVQLRIPDTPPRE